MARPRNDVVAKTVEMPVTLERGLAKAAKRAGESLTAYLLTAAAGRAGLEYTPRKRGRPPAEKSPGNST